MDGKSLANDRLHMKQKHNDLWCEGYCLMLLMHFINKHLKSETYVLF